MSNLSELLPAGGAAKEFEAVASGTLSNGQVVVLNSNGTVSAVSSDGPPAVGDSSIFETNPTYSIKATYDSNSNKVVVIYTDGASSSRGEAVVGTVSGSSISFGSPVVFINQYSNHLGITFDSNSNKVVVAYTAEGASYTGRAKVGTVSGTSISFGGEAQFTGSNAQDTVCTFDSNSNKVIFLYTGSVDQGTARVGTVSGTSISFGTEVVFNATGTYNLGATFDSNLNKVVVVYRGTSNYGRARVGTVSGTSISFGTEVVFNSATTVNNGAVFDSNANKTVIIYRDGGASDYGAARVGTVSGTSISFGTEVFFSSTEVVTPNAAFDSTSNKVVIAYRDSGNSNYGTAIVGTVSGTSISFGSSVVFENASAVYTYPVFDSSENRTVIPFLDSNDDGKATTFQATTSNASDFIGITQEAIADTATGLVTPQGGVNTSVSSLTTGSDYYVQDDGTLSTTVSSAPAGRALSSTSILLKG